MPKTKTSTSPDTKTLTYYLSLSYPYELVREDDGTFFASHPDLLGCFAQGDTPQEAIDALDDARQGWISVRFEDDLPIPPPIDEDSFSGKFLLRMAPSNHAALSKMAQRQGLSLNQLINSALSEYLGAARKESEVVSVILDAIASLEDKIKTPPPQSVWSARFTKADYFMRSTPAATGELDILLSGPKPSLLPRGEVKTHG